MTETTITFNDLGLPEFILNAVSEMGFSTPSPIQRACIPHLLNGHDVLGMAQTGSGKTAAFLCHYYSKIDTNEKYPQMLSDGQPVSWLFKFFDAYRQFVKFSKGMRIVTLYGGQRYDIQLRALKQGAQVVVGTPGRILDHIRRGTLDLSNLQSIVLDEADEMLRMSLLMMLKPSWRNFRSNTRTALFSATMPAQLNELQNALCTIRKK